LAYFPVGQQEAQLLHTQTFINDLRLLTASFDFFLVCDQENFGWNAGVARALENHQFIYMRVVGCLHAEVSTLSLFIINHF